MTEFKDWLRDSLKENPFKSDREGEKLFSSTQFIQEGVTECRVIGVILSPHKVPRIEGLRVQTNKGTVGALPLMPGGALETKLRATLHLTVDRLKAQNPEVDIEPDPHMVIWSIIRLQRQAKPFLSWELIPPDISWARR